MKIIVHVDDERDELERVMSELKENIDRGEIVLHSFLNPKDAYQFVRENTVDLVLTDYNMGELNGAELAEKIKEIKPDLIILLRSYSSSNFDPEIMDGTSNKAPSWGEKLVMNEIEYFLYEKQK